MVLFTICLCLMVNGFPFVVSETIVDTSFIGDTRTKILTDVTMGSIIPVVTETGKISLSIDGLGMSSASGIIQVEKSSGATVRSAFLAAATTGFTMVQLSDGDIELDGVGVSWIYETPSSIASYNYWADVTSIVKSKFDSALVGRVDYTVTEVSKSEWVDGVILAVIINDPSQVVDNTVVLLFGAQDVQGDTFAIGLADPIDTSDPNLVLDFSLGISFSHQPTGQFSQVDVNGIRLTTSAGGEDDGEASNGALLTVGGLDDSNANPSDPYQTGVIGPYYDDELYDLLPFVSNGDTTINIVTLNPSDDDNVFFSALFFGSARAWVEPGFMIPEYPLGSLMGIAIFIAALVAYTHIKYTLKI